MSFIEDAIEIGEAQFERGMCNVGIQGSFGVNIPSLLKGAYTIYYRPGATDDECDLLFVNREGRVKDPTEDKAFSSRHCKRGEDCVWIGPASRLSLNNAAALSLIADIKSDSKQVTVEAKGDGAYLSHVEFGRASERSGLTDAFSVSLEFGSLS